MKKKKMKYFLSSFFSFSIDLYEGLKRAQRSRLEDQRGTEINFELPDFLKVNGNSHHLWHTNNLITYLSEDAIYPNARTAIVSFLNTFYL